MVDSPPSKDPIRSPICSPSPFKSIWNSRNWRSLSPNRYGRSILPRQLYIGALSTRLYGHGFENLGFWLKNLKEHVSMHIDLAFQQPKMKVQISKALSEGCWTQNKDVIKDVLANELRRKHALFEDVQWEEIRPNMQWLKAIISKRVICQQAFPYQLHICQGSWRLWNLILPWHPTLYVYERWSKKQPFL